VRNPSTQKSLEEDLTKKDERKVMLVCEDWGIYIKYEYFTFKI